MDPVKFYSKADKHVSAQLSQVDSWLKKKTELQLIAKQRYTNDSWSLTTEIKIE
jgi:hypothetical protein